jgi:hypothetical protein
LVCFEAQFAEFIVIESSIIAMVMLNGDAMHTEMLLAVCLGFQCLLSVHLHLAIDEVLAGELVNEILWRTCTWNVRGCL